MKKTYTVVSFMLLILFLLSIPVTMVVLYRRAFEDFEISNIDTHLEEFQHHIDLFDTDVAADKDLYLSRVASYSSRHSDFGALILLDEDYEVLFPADEPSREARQELAEAFSRAIQRGELQNRSYFDTEDGRSYRVSFQTVSGKNGARYSVAYYDTDRSSTEIDRLESNYIQVAAISCLVFLGIGSLLYWVYCRYMQQLGDEILRIGTGDVSPVSIPQSVGAMNSVRRSVATAAEQLRRSAIQQKTMTQSANHFIRNRLMAIGGFAQGIETGVFPPEEAAVKIRAESTVIDDLLQNLSLQHYMKEQALPEGEEELIMAEELETCCSRYRSVAEPKGITISLRSDDREASFWGTKNLTAAVLDNLMSNAVRYASSKITVSAEKTAHQIVVRVEDDGKGIRESDMSRLFEPMSKGLGGNFGIGLSVAKDAAEYMGGSLRAENSPAGGAVFTFTVPAK